MSKDARPCINRGDIVRHFKREMIVNPGTEYLYQILEFAIHSENNERYVVYKALYGTGLVYVRPYDMFMSEVDHIKYPDIVQKWRFDKASTRECSLVSETE